MGKNPIFRYSFLWSLSQNQLHLRGYGFEIHKVHQIPSLEWISRKLDLNIYALDKIDNK